MEGASGGGSGGGIEEEASWRGKQIMEKSWRNILDEESCKRNHGGIMEKE